MGEVYVWSEMDAGNWEAPRGKGKFDIETGWAQKVVERYAPTYLSPPPLKLFRGFADVKLQRSTIRQNIWNVVCAGGRSRMVKLFTVVLHLAFNIVAQHYARLARGIAH